MEHAIFYTILTLIFLSEGVGIVGGREIAYIMLIAAPYFLLVMLLFKKRGSIVLPNISFLFILFLIFSGISTYFSPNFNTSLLRMFTYTAMFLWFIYIVNTPFLKRGVIPFLLAISIVYCLYSTAIGFFLLNQWEYLVPHNSIQFVYSYFGYHNHLGDILILPLFILLDYLFINNMGVLGSYIKFIKHKKIFFSGVLIFLLPYFILSFSRTAYIALACLLVIDILYKKKKKYIGVLGFSIVLLLLTFTVTSGINIPFFKDTNTFFSQNYNLGLKNLTGQRNTYGSQALQSFTKKPYWGVGPGNFSEVSHAYARSNQEYSSTSHNIFLDILSENGFFAFFAFISIICLMLLSRQKSMYYFLFFGLLIIFQTDYLFQFSSVILLFTILGAVVYIDTNNSMLLKEPEFGNPEKS